MLLLLLLLLLIRRCMCINLLSTLRPTLSASSFISFISQERKNLYQCWLAYMIATEQQEANTRLTTTNWIWETWMCLPFTEAPRNLHCVQIYTCRYTLFISLISTRGIDVNFYRSETLTSSSGHSTFLGSQNLFKFKWIFQCISG